LVGLKPPAEHRFHTKQGQGVEVDLLQDHALGSARTGHREVGLPHEGLNMGRNRHLLTLWRRELSAKLRRKPPVRKHERRRQRQNGQFFRRTIERLGSPASNLGTRGG
jgi:hypothetical protein